jgi:hypothetical protein
LIGHLTLSGNSVYALNEYIFGPIIAGTAP